MMATHFIKENVILFLPNLIEKVFMRFRVRDSDPLGTRLAKRGLVLGGERQAYAQPIASRI